METVTAKDQYPRSNFEERKPLVLYHAGCKDGFCAAWVAYQALGGYCELAPATYGSGSPPLDIVGRVVYILDFSYSKKILDQMVGACHQLILLDHHKTAEADLRGWVSTNHKEGLEPIVRFDMNRSGAGMTWDFFNGGVQRPWIVDYVEDRDIWNWKLSDSRAVNAFISTLKYTLEDWNWGSDQPLNRAIEYGSVILNKIDQYNDALINTLMQRISFDTYSDVPCMNAPQEGVSELMEEMLKRTKQPFCIVWRVRSDGTIAFSLRSVGDFDVSEIAKKFGGGGHRNAAGFELHGQSALNFLETTVK